MSSIGLSQRVEATSWRAPARDRVVSLDVLRGLTVAGMILVTDPGTYSAVYPQLRHAEWMGATATDMIMPSFLFAVGVAMPLSFGSRVERGADRARLALHVVRRSVLLLVLGLLVNGFPDYQWHTLRIPGILQRIGLCNLGSGLLYLATYRPDAGGERDRPERRMLLFGGVALGALLVYWAVLHWVPVPGIGAGHLDSYGNLPAYVDRALLTTQHMWVWGLTPGMGVTYDPDGLLTTLPAIATTLLGVATGEWMRTSRSGERKVWGMALVGAALVVAGWSLSPWLPLNKRIWTSTFGLLSSGVSLLVFAMLYAVVDLRRWRWWTPPALIFGTNAILAFAISTVITTMSDRIHVHTTDGSATLHQWGNHTLFATGMSPVHASLAYAVLIVLLNLALLVPLFRRRIFLRV